MEAAPRHALLVLAIVIAGCEAANTDLPNTKAPTFTGDAPPAGASAAAPNAAVAPGSMAAPGAKVSIALPDLKPVLAPKISTPRQVLDDGPFTGQRPSVRANDRHSFEVTGKDCMTCHGTGGTAPHFAFGGTIALGKQWTVGTPPWSTGKPSGNAYGSYDNYGSYDPSSSYDSYGGSLGGYDTGGYGAGGYGYDDGGYGGGGGCGGGLGGLFGGYDTGDYDTGSYNTGGGGLGGIFGGGGYNTGSYDDDSYDSYGGGGGGGCGPGRKGWPADRTKPSPYTGVRLVGADGYVFDTVTDDDGNFWYKSASDVAVPAFTGIRYGTFTVTGDTNGIACASCHESGKPDSPGRLWTWDGPTPR